MQRIDDGEDGSGDVSGKEVNRMVRGFIGRLVDWLI